MKFNTKIDETLFISTIASQQDDQFCRRLDEGLSVIWNVGNDAQFKVDNKEIRIKKNCVIFLTEFYNVDSFEFQQLNVIQFSRQFYCVESNDELGCRGLLFFGEQHVPKIILPADTIKQFKLLWEVFMMEMEEEDDFKLEMLRSLLKRFLILCLRVYKKQNNNLPTDNSNVALIRKFNYLVEKNYKTHSKVSDYAQLLHKSPKTLSNIFSKYINRTPLQIINERRFLEAKRMLLYTDQLIYEIAEELNFKDVQSFSHFFSVRAGVAPSSFRATL
ncbi:AraC family transcriptional regulator [Aureispira anguillae]|uniref:Helix-turn-helix domain-containing protein n=1 Tax=Aureispira anguillae TaxID=2864201 RepID=A0A915YLN7_9BACT|nr:helix-turn-helix domain-containing protein [Aureispira anguillae]BDS15509.1 helix-turn-helix domain-containing protein [Aureispira anguillae]